MALDLRPHQVNALNKLSNGKILWGGVGSGKTHVAVAYYEKREAPKDVYVITTARKRDDMDWEKTFSLIGVGKAPDATVAGVLRVDSWNNIGKYRDVVGAFFIFDEQRLVGSGEWSNTFLKIAKNNGWILLSATPGDTWLDYIPVFVANGFYKNRTEFKREHVVYAPYVKFPKVDRYVNTGRLARQRHELLVEMPYKRHTKRETIVVPVDYDAPLFEKVLKQRWNPYEERPLQDVAELFRVMRRVANSDTSRLEAVRQLLEKHPRLIVFYNFNYELESLRTLSLGTATTSGKILTARTRSAQEEDGEWQTRKPADTGYLASASNSNQTDLLAQSSSFTASAARPSSRTISSTTRSTSSTSARTSGTTSPSLVVAEWNGHKHQPVPETERWLYLVQFAAGAEAWNCITTDAMCMYSLPYSYKFWHQAHGRIDRMDTPYSILRYYILKSRSLIDLEVAKSLANKEDFNESRFVASRQIPGGK